MMERMMEYDAATYHLFVDFKTAYDFIIRKKVQEAMQELGFPKN
jgi:sorting nexin-29